MDFLLKWNEFQRLCSLYSVELPSILGLPRHVHGLAGSPSSVAPSGLDLADILIERLNIHICIRVRFSIEGIGDTGRNLVTDHSVSTSYPISSEIRYNMLTRRNRKSSRCNGWSRRLRKLYLRAPDASRIGSRHGSTLPWWGLAFEQERCLCNVPWPPWDPVEPALTH
jgi:hypothetical protein